MKYLDKFSVSLLSILTLDVRSTLANEDETTENEMTLKASKAENEKKSLVVYFSLPLSEDVNDMSKEAQNSGIVINGQVLGNTQYVAQLIQEKMASDIFRIEPVKKYTHNYADLVQVTQKEHSAQERPNIANSIPNFNNYQTIFIGFPNWFGDMPMIIYSFLEAYNFDKKAVNVFITHGGSGLSDTVNSIQKKAKNAIVNENALAISRQEIAKANMLVDEWLQKINKN